MPDPDPNPKVTLAGSGVLLHGVRDDGEIIPIEVTDAGELKTTASVSTGGLATLTEQEAQTALLTSLDDKITTATDTPTGTDPGVVVRLVQSGPILTSVANQTFAGAIPGPSDSGQLVRVIPTDAVTVDQCLGVVLATNHQPITTSGRAFVATRDKGATLQGDVTSTDLSADRQLLDVAVYQSVLPPDAAKDSSLTTISTQLDQTNISLGNISIAQTDGTQKTQITNGVDSADVIASAPTGTEQGLVTRNIPSGTQAVSGPLTDMQLRASPVPVSISAGGATIGVVDQGLGGASAWKIDGSAVTQPVSDAGGSLTVDDGGASLTIDTPQLPAVLVGGRLSVDGSGVTQPISVTVTETNSATIATNTGRIPAQGQALASASTPVVLPLSQAAGALALQAQLPAALGAGGGVKVDGSGTPLPVGGTVAISSLPGSPAQEHTTAASPNASRLSDGAAFYKAATAGDNMGADLRVSGTAVSNANPVPISDAGGSVTIDNADLTSLNGKVPAQGPALYTAAQPVVLARASWVADSSSLPAAATSFLISAVPASLRRLEWRYTGAGTKYICIFDQTATPATASAWTRWYRPMTNGAGISWFEWPEGLFCASGIVVGVVATEPAAGVAITPSTSTNENFTIANYSFQ